MSVIRARNFVLGCDTLASFPGYQQREHFQVFSHIYE